MSIILKAENISKQYRLGTVGAGTLGDDLKRWWYGIRGREDPFLKVGAVNDRQSEAHEDYVWALRDINFEVKQGEVLGIIGKNGAGKSTLLKLLSRVTSPTTGTIKTKGRIASLLEVGTGFHGELTGRENIFMNGAVLGMTRAEIKTKIDEIIAFSGCEKYIDTPVKRYSSGMTVRLGFAVAAHLEPEILVVDEVLAVGDAEFQKKAIGKMQDLSTGQGRTVLFVSHNMISIQQLCDRCVLLENGAVSFIGNVNETVRNYLEDQNQTIQKINFPIYTESLKISSFSIVNENQQNVTNLFCGFSYSFVLEFENIFSEVMPLDVRIQIFNSSSELITTLNSFHKNKTFPAEAGTNYSIHFSLAKLSLSPGKYIIGIEIRNRENLKVLFDSESITIFNVVEADYFNSGKIPLKKNFGKVFTDFNVKVLEK